MGRALFAGHLAFFYIFLAFSLPIFILLHRTVPVNRSRALNLSSPKAMHLAALHGGTHFAGLCEARGAGTLIEAWLSDPGPTS